MEKVIDLTRENIKPIISGVAIIFVLALIITLIVFRGGNTPRAVLGEQVFNLEIAKTEEEKQIGLSGKDSLDEDRGMLFIFDEPGYYPFWMKDMVFPIDIIFINGDRIVTIYKSVSPKEGDEPPSVIYHPSEPADKVLEINAGLSEKYDFKVGDSIRIENL